LRQNWTVINTDGNELVAEITDSCHPTQQPTRKPIWRRAVEQSPLAMESQA
jgi:hypothetical protein